MLAIFFVGRDIGSSCEREESPFYSGRLRESAR